MSGSRCHTDSIACVDVLVVREESRLSVSSSCTVKGRQQDVSYSGFTLQSAIEEVIVQSESEGGSRRGMMIEAFQMGLSFEASGDIGW